uniref:Glycosyltransferase 61 catalytic domain-containing protein n=1 Tax=Cyclophora tenuis TaxID=216820 RepID=A0A7S1D4R6_CYCTE|mmetsp:Transcript_22819/g.38823  ORF Transcript_22819/g.38823 Transcript_22819/m.38823 type:complete len:429 (+) Transcript_22819:259-1545(+)
MGKRRFAATIGYIAVVAILTDGPFDNIPRYLSNVRRSNVTNEECDGVPLSIPKLFDRRKQQRKRYERATLAAAKHFNDFDDDLPKIQVLEKANYYVHRSGRNPQAVAWTDDKNYVQGPGWVTMDELEPPLLREPKVDRVLVGNYVAYTSWFEGNFGHYLDDHLPSIAYLRKELPLSIKFLLLDTKLSRSVLKFLDPYFYQNRIEWIRLREIVRVEGNLTVSIPVSIPLMHGRGRPHQYLREWVNEQHPVVPEKRAIVFYSRSSVDTHHKRIVDRKHERQVVDTVRAAMTRYHRREELVVFDGSVFNRESRNYTTMSIAEQFRIFRSAKTIIGPHGAGMLGNLVWVDPFPPTCHDRVQVLEFIPGPESEQVQAVYRSLFIRWRSWPVDFSVLLYSKESTHDKTFINLDNLNDALEGLWGKQNELQVASA